MTESQRTVVATYGALLATGVVAAALFAQTPPAPLAVRMYTVTTPCRKRRQS